MADNAEAQTAETAEVDVYAEYRTNLYTERALGCVRNADSSNIYKHKVPLKAVKDRFAREEIYMAPAYFEPQEGGRRLPIAGMSVKVRLADMRAYPTLVSSEVTPQQYNFLVDLGQAVTGEGSDIIITAAGTTRNGGRGYLQFSTENVHSVAGMDYAPFVSLGMSHDGSLAITSVTGNMIVVCANMVAGLFGKAAFAEAGVKGTRTRQSKHATAARHITRHSVALDLAREADAMDKAIADLAKVQVSDAQWSEFVKIMFPAADDASKRAITRAENNRERLTQLYKADERVAPWHGTALGVMQAANTFDIWERGTRGDTDPNVRQFDDMLSGTLAKAENDAAKALTLVLA